MGKLIVKPKTSESKGIPVPVTGIPKKIKRGKKKLA